MAMRHWLTALFLASAAPGALAQDGAQLTAAEARAALFGHELSGVTDVSGTAWRECIERTGETIYRFGPDFIAFGRVSVADDGQACFRYAHTHYQQEVCWILRRRGENFEFEDPSGSSEAFIVLARPRVNGCGEDAPVA